LAHTRPVRLLVTLACACTAAAALPALAAGAPANDNYLASTAINTAGSVLPGTSTRTGDIILATVQSDILEGNVGGPIAENLGCVRPGFPAVMYGDTVWWDIYPHRPGFVRVVAEATDFEPVVGIMPFTRSNAVPDLANFRCVRSGLGNATLDYEFPLVEGGGYTIQLGAVDGSGFEGPYTLTVYFNPDTDRDGAVDSQDSCPNEGGANLISGCPDTDGDGVINSADRCPGASGTAPHSGCPDADGDGKIDPDDACQRESTRGKRDRNDNGCPDRELLKPETKLTPGLFCTGAVCHGIRVNKLIVSEIPRGTRVTVACTKHACKKASKKVGKNRQVRFFSGQKLEAGVGLAITLARRGYVSRRITYWIKPNDWKKTNSCLKSGKPVRCSRQLLVR
jgi:hypothetical protein